MKKLHNFNKTYNYTCNNCNGLVIVSTLSKLARHKSLQRCISVALPQPYYVVSSKSLNIGKITN